jgi:hypothetical protein
MKRYIQTVGIAVVFCAASAHAAYIDVGTHTLLPNTPDQVVEIVLHADPSDGRLLSVDLVAFLAPLGRPLEDFVTDPPAPSPATGPVFTGMDLIGPGTIFHASNTGVFPGGTIALPRWRSDSTLTPANEFVVGEGVLARLTLDTTGIFAMPDQDLLYPLLLANHYSLVSGWTEVLDEFGRTILGEPTPSGAPYRVTPGYIRIAASPGLQSAAISEPASAALALAGVAGVCLLRRWTRKAKP